MDAISKSFRIVAFIGTIIGLLAFMDQCLNILTSIFVTQYQTLLKPDELAPIHCIIMAFVFIITNGGQHKNIASMPNIICPENPYFDKSSKLRPTKEAETVSNNNAQKSDHKADKANDESG